MLFQTYRFDNLETDELRFIDGWSYSAAAVGGPIYVAAKGFPMLSLAMVAVTVLLAAVATGCLIVVVGLVDDTVLSIVATALIPPVAMAGQAVIAIRLVRAGLVQRGWKEGY